MASDFQPPGSNISAAIPAGMDAFAVGLSIFGGGATLEPPEVEGFADLEFLAEGGAGKVWRAIRRADGLAVALKAPHHMDPETIERIGREADALRAIDHPNIVKLLDVTESATGEPILVMELVDGSNLTQRLPAEGFDFEHALQLFLPILAGVEHAHSRGLVHRDLKPSNILVDVDGCPKVSDFGLATSVKDRQLAFSLTRSGVVAGTVEYLAPECYEPDFDPSPAADVFALGVIFYEMLTGRPPRGSWPRLSDVKRLDLRLNGLLADAIHPDPARRIASAANFSHRLVEIRDSRPRYSGAPMINRATRIADTLWTVGGLYLLAGGFCSLLKINNTEVPGVFDLTFGHSRLLGGYWAFWIMCVGMGLLWFWQSIRLWRFRGVGLREALPSPFGLRLGYRRGAAIAVGFSQLLCAWAPLIYAGWIGCQCWYWAGTEAAPWDHVLAVTRWGSEVPVSPWTWDWRGMISADEFWIREMRAGQSPGEWVLVDRQSFFVVVQPLAMLLGIASVAVGLLATLAVAAVAWLPGRWKHFFAVFGLVVMGAASIGATRLAERAYHRKVPRTAEGWLARRIGQRINSDALPRAAALFDFVSGTKDWSESELDRWLRESCAETILIGEKEVSRRDFGAQLRRLHDSAGQNVAVEAQSPFRVDYPKGPAQGFRLTTQCECYGEGSDGTCRGIRLHFAIAGRHAGPTDGSGEPRLLFDEWQTAETVLYESGMSMLSVGDAEKWATAFLQCVSAPGCPELESFFLPKMLVPRSNEKDLYEPGESAALVAFFRRSSAAGATIRPAPSAVRSVALRGGRIEVTFSVVISRNGTAQSSPFPWTAELVPGDGRWRILRLKM